MGMKIGQGILQAPIKIIGQLKNTLGMRLLKVCLNGSLDQGSLICLIFLVYLSLNMLINVMLIKKNVLESESHIIISNVDYHFSFVFQEHLEVSVLEYWEWYGLDLL